jgi:anti-anti-sigma factor
MDLQTQQLTLCDLVIVSGTVMSTDIHTLERTLQRFLIVGRYHILLDLQDCNYIGSAGLSMLISFANSCRRWKRGDLFLVAPHAYVQNLLEIAGLQSEEHSFFRTFKTREEGLNAFGESAFSSQVP